ncbi:MAG: GAF domain-containing protein, partial [bacterium]|nr:GAF domain-containing protein [bacterium]
MDININSKNFRSSIKKRIFVSDKSILEKLDSLIDNKDISYVLIDSLKGISNSNSLDLFLLSEQFFITHESALKKYFYDNDNQPAKLYYFGNNSHELKTIEIIDSIITLPVSYIYLMKSIRSGFKSMQAVLENKFLHEEIFNVNNQISELSHIGQQLMMEKDLGKLLSLILLKSREMASADAGSLYLVEENDKKEKSLRFTLTQNDSVSFEFEEFTMPISRKSISGYVADTGSTVNIEDVNNLPEDSEFSFNKSFDEDVGYRSKSMLVIPLKNHVDEIIGVVQLINRKKEWLKELTDTKTTEENVIPFTGECLNTVSALAGQAAVSIENNLLYRNIERLFEGFVNASVGAIESRDPTTSGHSSRVAVLTVNLARKIDGINNGKFKNIYFSADQVKEIRYASLLHDFGKVGVREPVLLKSKKLYPDQITDIMHRLGHHKRYEEICALKAKLKHLLEKGVENHKDEFIIIENEL